MRMVFAGRKVRGHLIVKFDNQVQEELKATKLLGVIFTSNFLFQEHIYTSASKARKRIAILSRLLHILPKLTVIVAAVYLAESLLSFAPMNYIYWFNIAVYLTQP